MRGTVKIAQIAARVILWTMGAFSLGTPIIIILYVLSKGLPHVTPAFLFAMPEDMGRAGGILPTLTTTVYVTLLALVFAAPVGIGAAIYLAEYTRDGFITHVLRYGTETLAGVPSIIFGLFGAAFFVYVLNRFTGGLSILSGALTLALMLLPILVRTAEESIKAVPRSYREGSLALGATKWQTITRVVLPSAWSGILTGILLGMGRAIGETAALWLTLGGSILRVPFYPWEQGRTMTLHLYVLAMEGLSLERAFATAACLVLAVLAVNTTAFAMLRRFNRRRLGRAA